MKKGNKKVHEDFHQNTSTQKKLITKDNFTYRIILEVLEKYAKEKNAVLDIGCGSGTITFYLSTKSKSVEGIDISQRAIDLCRKSQRNLDIENVSFTAMDFPYQAPRKVYDLIVCLEVIEHLVQDDLAISRMFDLLKPNGIVIVSTPSSNAPLHRIGYTKKFDKRVGHLRRYNIEQLAEMFNKVGFRILATKRTEGIIRNFLFLNPIAGKTIRFIKYFISDLVTAMDQISLTAFGESDIFIIAQKPGDKR